MFYVWIESPNDVNTLKSNDFNSDSQRQNGFQAGKAASAKRVNTALRQANLIAIALMNALDLNTSQLSAQSSVNDVKNAIQSTNLYKLSNLFTYNASGSNVNTTLLPNTLGISLGSPTKPFNNIYGATIFENNVSLANKYVFKDTNSGTQTIKSSIKIEGSLEVDGGINATITGTSDNAKNVTEQINGKNITDIFEADGTTVKEATNADKVNNLEIKLDTNDVLKIGNNSDNIISRKDLLTNADYTINSNDHRVITDSNITANTLLEVHTSLGVFRFKDTYEHISGTPMFSNSVLSFSDIQYCFLQAAGGMLDITYKYYDKTSGLSKTAKMHVTRVYKIIE